MAGPSGILGRGESGPPVEARRAAALRSGSP